MLIWGIAYAWLSFFSFVLATPQDWASMVKNGRILPEYVEYISRIPDWIIAFTATAAFTRLFGSIGLALKKTWAIPMYSISLVCVIVIMFRAFVLVDVTSVIRTSQVWVEVLFMALSIFAVWFSLRSKTQGLLS